MISASLSSASCLSSSLQESSEQEGRSQPFAVALRQTQDLIFLYSSSDANCLALERAATAWLLSGTG
jgi:hypothetical protein